MIQGRRAPLRCALAPGYQLFAPFGAHFGLLRQSLAATNTPFLFTFGLTAPVDVVSAPFYADAAIVWPPLFVSTLETGITPMPIPINKTIQCTVSAKNAQTGVLVPGRVKIDGRDVAATNTPFSKIFKPRRAGAELELVMPVITVS